MTTHDRSKFIGSSDIAPICGLSPWKSAYDVWAEKTGKVPPSDLDNDAMRVGRMFERTLVENAVAGSEGVLELDTRVTRDIDGIPATAQLDGLWIVGDKRTGIEAKTCGNGEGFGEEESDNVPDSYALQATWQIVVAKLDSVIIPALLGGRGGFRIRKYQVEPSPRLAELLLEKASAFWMCVQRDIPPPSSLCSPETARRMIRPEGKTVVVPIDLMVNWRGAVESRKLAEKLEADSLAALHTAGGDAEVFDAGPAGRLVFSSYERKAYTVEAGTVKRSTYKPAKGN